MAAYTKLTNKQIEETTVKYEKIIELKLEAEEIICLLEVINEEIKLKMKNENVRSEVVNVKLPKFEIKKFYGEITKFIEFWKFPCSEEICSICKESKQRRKPYNETIERATRVLQIVHADVLIIEDKYVLTITDDYSRYAVCFIMSHKSEVAENFESYVKKAEAMHNIKVLKLRCDRGGEFTSDRLKKFCENQGIIIQYTATNIHQHNGVSERMNSLLENTMRAQLFQAGMPRKFWESALINALYIINRSPSDSTERKTRFEQWRGYKPKLKNVKVFGSVVYVRKEKFSSKLEERSVLGILVGHRKPDI